MKVSVVTPSFNQAEFLESTLASVASQGTNVEHLVFDGGSTDGSVAILERFRPPVRWVSARDAGQADAVNKGIAASDGEVIGWLNSDDVYYPGAICRVVAYFEAHPGVDLVYGMADHIGPDDCVLEPYPTEPFAFECLPERLPLRPSALRTAEVVHRGPDERVAGGLGKVAHGKGVDFVTP